MPSLNCFPFTQWAQKSCQAKKPGTQNSGFKLTDGSAAVLHVRTKHLDPYLQSLSGEGEVEEKGVGVPNILPGIWGEPGTWIPECEFEEALFPLPVYKTLPPQPHPGPSLLSPFCPLASPQSHFQNPTSSPLYLLPLQSSVTLRSWKPGSSFLSKWCCLEKSPALRCSTFPFSLQPHPEVSLHVVIWVHFVNIYPQVL